MRVSQLDLSLVGKSARVGDRIARRVHRASCNHSKQFMSTCLAQRRFSSGKVIPSGINCRFGGLEAGDGFVFGLLTVNSLLGQRHNTAGVGLLVVIVCLGLCQRSLRRAYHGFRINRGTAGLTVCLALRLYGFPELPAIAGNVGFGGFTGRIQIGAFDDRNELTSLYLLALFDQKRLDAAGNLGAYHNFICVHCADQLQIGSWPHCDQVPDERPYGQQTQNKKNSISRAHLCLTDSELK